MLEQVNLQSFDFQSQQVRTLTINDEPWFVAADVCKVLEIANSRHAVSRLDEDEKGVATNDTLGGPQDATIINESGLYSLILTSRKPQAKAFKRWVTHEVLPAIRKTGHYSLTPTTSPRITPHGWGRYAALMAELERLWCEATQTGAESKDLPLAIQGVPVTATLLRNQIWVDLLTDLEKEENSRLKWRAIVTVLQALAQLERPALTH